MLQTNFKNQQIEHEKTKTYTFQIFQFHYHYWFIGKNVLIKTQKPHAVHADGLMVKLSVSQAVPVYTHEFKSRLGHFSFFFPQRFFFFYCKFIPAKGFQHIFNNAGLV